MSHKNTPNPKTLGRTSGVCPPRFSINLSNHGETNFSTPIHSISTESSLICSCLRITIANSKYQSLSMPLSPLSLWLSYSAATALAPSVQQDAMRKFNHQQHLLRISEQHKQIKRILHGSNRLSRRVGQRKGARAVRLIDDIDVY